MNEYEVIEIFPILVGGGTEDGVVNIWEIKCNLLFRTHMIIFEFSCLMWVSGQTTF